MHWFSFYSLILFLNSYIVLLKSRSLFIEYNEGLFFGIILLSHIGSLSILTLYTFWLTSILHVVSTFHILLYFYLLLLYLFWGLGFFFIRSLLLLVDAVLFLFLHWFLLFFMFLIQVFPFLLVDVVMFWVSSLPTPILPGSVSYTHLDVYKRQV